ncbi:MAG: TonB-dependent receptor [Xanthomonadales bacterium]|nr:TonB-dependent receptor [Gammaproteobacteria bacterium]NNK52570.1 TonB-dependent receptor [Xanthomonadales bacterium]
MQIINPAVTRFLNTGCCLFFLLNSVTAAGDDIDMGASALEEVVVTATRIPTDLQTLPFAASVVGREEVQRARQQLGLDESLAAVPGLFFQNRYNFAQDLRIAIRGFGARANFGIRGIRIFADDIPQTLPDGQGSVDAIDLGSIEQIQVIRGPFSAVYGSASGGVIDIRTEDGPATPILSGRLNLGSYDYRQAQVKAGGQAGKLNWLANLSDTRLDGYRDHADFESRLFNSKFRYEFNDTARLTVVFNAVDSPTANDPGGLNAREVAEDRRQAAPRNLLFNAGESLDQQSLGLAFRKEIGTSQELMLRNYYVHRQFNALLPFSINSNGQGGSIDLSRRFSGLGGNYSWTTSLGSRTNRVVAGLDYDAQRDHRRRSANNEGVIGMLTTDQDEDVTTTGIYLQNVLDLSATASLTLGGRFDDVDYEVTDRTAGDGSGQRSFSQFSPMIGVHWSLHEAVDLYGNVSRSFDPPATTELANPFGPTGFNQELDSQTATNYELGMKGLLSGRLRYELALFHIAVKDGIVPYELEGSGQSFFQNAGASTHEGLEASVTLELFPGATGTATYTWSDFRFDQFSDTDGTVYDGNRIPGIPRHLFNLDLAWTHPSGFFAGWDFLYVGRFFADNANQVETDDYLVSNLRAGYRWTGGRWTFEPFAGVNNLFNRKYIGNVRLNASFGRYYEPAPERNVYAGVLLKYGF